MYQDVGEWRRCVPDVGALVEGVEELANALVEDRGVMIRIRLADFIKGTCPRIDRPLIGLIIDYEQRDALDIRASLVIFVLRNPTDPIQ